MKEKIILLLPLSFNDGTAIPQTTLNAIFEELFVFCGGYRIAGKGPGAYRMSDGAKQLDETLEVWAAVGEADIPALERLTAHWCSVLGQECIWFERTGGKVDLIGPSRRRIPRSPERGPDEACW